MMAVENSRLRQTENSGITRIAVSGFKSIDAEQAIEIAPLTILAGVNSSGKSSIMQPLLLIKQTLEAQFDAGALNLSGANARFTEADQIIFKGSDRFTLAFSLNDEVTITLHFVRGKQESGLRLDRMDYQTPDTTHSIHEKMSDEQMIAFISAVLQDRVIEGVKIDLPTLFKPPMQVQRNRSFLEIITFFGTFPEPLHQRAIQSVIHVPGLRGLPGRTYPAAVVGETFSGTFDLYTASVVLYWQENKLPETKRLTKQLANLGLTSTVLARRRNAVEIELLVGRTMQSGKDDLVSVADVGLGVSHILPVLVALLTAKPGQMVYIEQPEIHLHPRAQVAMADILADAAKSGVRVVIETHSALLLTGVQTLIAQGSLSPELVRLHWFNRDEEGVTTIESVTPDHTGAYGDWPIDFDDVELTAQQHYLDAAETRLMESVNGRSE